MIFSFDNILKSIDFLSEEMNFPFPSTIYTVRINLVINNSEL